jgi:SepF-like predicted cell division protein (DUF552 family)
MGLAQTFRAVAGQFGVGSGDYDDYDDDEEFTASADDEHSATPLAIVRPQRLAFSLVTPQDFDAAQRIADHLRGGTPVIVDLQACGRDLAERLIDFCSGLTYALDGSVEYLGENVVLLAPHNVELSSEALGGLQERRFLNQF